jgi:hypothetical protein
LESSCSVIYKSPYYVPDKPKDWTHESHLSRYTHPRIYKSLRSYDADSISANIEVSFSHTQGDFDSGAKAKWIGVILPIIPQISFNQKREKAFNSKIAVNLISDIPFDDGTIYFVINKKLTIKPIGFGSTGQKSTLPYKYLIEIKDEEILRKITSIEIKTEDEKLNWLNGTTFYRKNKTVWFHVEGAN